MGNYLEFEPGLRQAGITIRVDYALTHIDLDNQPAVQEAEALVADRLKMLGAAFILDELPPKDTKEKEVTKRLLGALAELDTKLDELAQAS